MPLTAWAGDLCFSQEREWALCNEEQRHLLVWPGIFCTPSLEREEPALPPHALQPPSAPLPGPRFHQETLAAGMGGPMGSAAPVVGTTPQPAWRDPPGARPSSATGGSGALACGGVAGSEQPPSLLLPKRRTALTSSAWQSESSFNAPGCHNHSRATLPRSPRDCESAH